MTIEPCSVEGCDQLGPFTTDDGPRCIEHAAYMVVEHTTPPTPDDGLNDVAARALAAVVLQHTADALTTDAAKMENAIVGLAADLPAPLEVAAGVLFATTALAGTAGLTDQEVFGVASAFEEQAIDESEEENGQ